MGVVTRQELHRYMSEPHWTAAQESEADRLCEAVEADLEAALFGMHITPVERIETAPLTREGLVDTAHPVHQVLELDGASLDPDDPLPEDYELRAGRLFHRPVGGVEGALASGWPWTPPLPTVVPPYPGGVVRIRYMAGWGDHPSLVDAILHKAADRMTRRHADVVTTTGLATQAPTAPPPQEFTPAELAPLGRFRNLGWGSSGG